MSVLISDYPNYNFSLFCFKGTVSLLDSVRSFWPEQQELTNEIALKILKQVKLKSDILNILTDLKCVIISLALVAAPTLLISFAMFSLVPIAFVAFAVNGCFGKVKNSIFQICSNSNSLSQAYALQSLRCTQLIAAIEADSDIDLQIDE